jgi:hypothetical protein
VRARHACDAPTIGDKQWGEPPTDNAGRSGKKKFSSHDTVPAGCSSFSGLEAQRARELRGAAGVAAVPHAINHGHLMEVEGTYSIQTRNVDAVLRLVGSALMVSVDAATRAEKMLCRSGVEAVARQQALATEKVDVSKLGRNGDGAAHPAIRACAPTDRLEAVAQFNFESHLTAVTLAQVHLRNFAHGCFHLISNTRASRAGRASYQDAGTG